MTERRIGIRKLRLDLSATIRRAALGETVEITDRGRPVARIVPLINGRGLPALIAAGAVRPSVEKGPLPPPLNLQSQMTTEEAINLLRD